MSARVADDQCVVPVHRVVHSQLQVARRMAPHSAHPVDVAMISTIRDDHVDGSTHAVQACVKRIGGRRRKNRLIPLEDRSLLLKPHRDRTIGIGIGVFAGVCRSVAGFDGGSQSKIVIDSISHKHIHWGKVVIISVWVLIRIVYANPQALHLYGRSPF